MENVNKFSFSRMWDITVRDITMNSKSYLSRGIIVVATVLGGLVLFLVSSKISISDHSVTFNVVQGAFSVWYSLVVDAGSLVAASMLLAATKNKSTCIDMLSVPGTMLEKFLSRVLIYIIGYYLLSLIALEVSSLLFYPLGCIFGVDGTGSLSYNYLRDLPSLIFPVGSIIYYDFNFYSSFTTNSLNRVLMAMIPLLMSLWTISFFVLGSAVWRRFAFGLTLACYFTLLVLGIVASFTVFNAHLISNIFVVDALLLAFTVFNWLKAYKMFCNKQIVDIKR